jgi:tRNA (cytidine/uridine-2'-O-)-methyltransferase
MPLSIVLYQPEIPPNTGNIARTCAITGATLHLIKPLGFSIDDKQLKRAGLDYWHLLNLEIHENLDIFLETYGHRPLFFATTKGTQYYDEVNYPEDSMIVFGRETSGLPQMIHDRYPDRRIKLPMLSHPDLRSLNLSNAANIILYEALRQGGFKGLKTR